MSMLSNETIRYNFYSKYNCITTKKILRGYFILGHLNLLFFQINMLMSRHSHNKYSIIRKKYTDLEFGNYAKIFCCNKIAQK